MTSLLYDIKFLCGCSLQAKIAFGYQRRFIGRREINGVIVETGDEICPEHGVREYGFITKDAIASGRLKVVGQGIKP